MFEAKPWLTDAYLRRLLPVPEFLSTVHVNIPHWLNSDCLGDLLWFQDQPQSQHHSVWEEEEKTAETAAARAEDGDGR